MDFRISILVTSLVSVIGHERFCDVRSRTEYGWVCGLQRPTAAGGVYASFRGIPYAKQPVGKLRFKELQPPEPWLNDYDAIDEGPICVQDLHIYGDLLRPQYGMSEACIHVNVHVPIQALPHDDKETGNQKYDDAKDAEDDTKDADDDTKDAHDDTEDGEISDSYDDEKDAHRENKDREVRSGVPIVVFIHGGGYGTGSGDADLHGPEYLVSKGVIVVTFNYRLNVFGFLSLNTSSIPGNNGLRDMVTLLRWVQRNAKYFGGDNKDVTLMGNSVGANFAQLLSLSDAAKGLFTRLFLSSGTALPTTFTSSPVYAANVAAQLLYILGISATDPEEIHDILTEIPIERIIHANSILQSYFGIVTFIPVIETRFPGVTTVIDKNPEESLAEGRGKEYPTVLGYNTNECEFFRANLGYGRYVQRVIANPRLLLPLELAFTLPSNVSLALGQKVLDRCFAGPPNLDEVVQCFSEILFVYPAYRAARLRAKAGGAPLFLYQFSYMSQQSLIKRGLGTDYVGTAHVEDQTFMLKVNSILGEEPSFPPVHEDDMMRDWFTMFVINFIKCNDPTCQERGWPKVDKHNLYYEDIEEPFVYKIMRPTHEQQDLIDFYDEIYAESNKYSTQQQTDTLNKL